MNSATLKQVPCGEASFAYLRKAGWAFVDKTPFIRTLEDCGCRFSVLMRPRRFGKSLFANMLAAYYDKAAAGDFEKNFAGTWIAQHPTPSAGRRLILKFDFSGVGGSREAVSASFMIKLMAGLWQFVKRYLPGNPQLAAVLDEEHADPAALLTAFLSTVQALVSDRIFLIIDEYDYPAVQQFFRKDAETFSAIAGTEGLLHKFYAVIHAFSRTLIDRGFIAGVTSISLNSVTSGLPLAADISHCPAFASCVGFTVEDLRKLIPEVVDTRRYGRGVDEILGRMKALYDGYRFSPESDVTVLNSSMALCCLREVARENAEPLLLTDPAFSSGPSTIEAILALGRPDFAEDVVENVLWERPIPFEPADGMPTGNADGITREGVLSCLIFSGFLTLSQESAGHLVCPNPVVREVFFQCWFRRLSKTENLTFPPTALKEAVERLKAGDADPLLALVTERLGRCLAGNAHARPDETAMLFAVSMALCTRDDYRVTAVEKDRESGCAELILRPARPNPAASGWRLAFGKAEGASGAVKARRIP